MYTVLKAFIDAQDDNHVYNVGDIYPRRGLEVTDDRLEELSTKKNSCGVVLISLEASGVASSRAEEVNAGVSPSKTTEAKKKPRKRKEK